MNASSFRRVVLPGPGGRGHLWFGWQKRRFSEGWGVGSGGGRRSVADRTAGAVVWAGSLGYGVGFPKVAGLEGIYGGLGKWGWVGRGVSLLGLGVGAKGLGSRAPPWW